MNLMRRLATIEDEIAKVNPPVTEEELQERQDLYDVLTPAKFSRRLIDSWIEPVMLEYSGQKFPIQMNFCSDPFCKWFG